MNTSLLFLRSLLGSVIQRTFPVGGDFNIIRCQEEKNNSNFNARWPFVFNVIIESFRSAIYLGQQKRYTHV